MLQSKVGSSPALFEFRGKYSKLRAICFADINYNDFYFDT